ncbi:MAG: branched-chain amino acid ABC transporter substrate-binding protein [Phreatobacter sp.]|uniref:branched-chain amino acid ABC transporter substrate-binding protein n=1 Tax=Phreatobacter sp. TaxID=1966341 RepID=UPI002735B45A|nr:branched-chain amino acid ABC transporter substrate-binding protein [Phreatobacter sp.]MDP2803708.1 branched-chain amino acid ABC transporter substrate-binding protein [Phreatobacter sp.]
MKTKLLAGLTLGLGLALALPAQAQIRLGVAGPITGPNASFGAQLRQGVEQAVEDINAAGGILGQRIQLSVGDDVSDPRQGVSVANKFVGDGIKFVVGHFNSGVSIPASEVYAENGIVAITPASTNPRLTERGLWNVFRTCGRDDQQGAVAAAFLVRNFAGKRVAIVHDKTTYGKGLADETQKAMNAAGLKEVIYEGVNTGEKDFSALISKLKAANVDVVYWGGLHTEGGLIVRQMRDQGVSAPLMSGDGIADNEFAAIAGPGAVGTLMTFPPDPRNRAEARAVVEKFRTARRFEPQAYTLYSYAAVQILQQAAVATNSLDPKKIAEFMRTGHVFKTVIGDISYDKKGDITRADYVMYTWRAGPDGKVSYFESSTTN